MERSVRMGTLFTRELLTYPKSNEWSQGTSKISDTKRTHRPCRKYFACGFVCHLFILIISKMQKMLKTTAAKRRETK